MIKRIINILIMLSTFVYLDYKLHKNDSKYSSYMLHEKELKIFNFTNKFNPTLVKKLKKIKNELKASNKRIKELERLKTLFPNQKELIVKVLNQYQKLNFILISNYNNIYSNIEAGYAMFKIDEVENHQSFKNDFLNLLKQADKTLQNTKNIKSTIERNLYNE